MGPQGYEAILKNEMLTKWYIQLAIRYQLRLGSAGINLALLRYEKSVLIRDPPTY